jgi:hypothetical protein
MNLRTIQKRIDFLSYNVWIRREILRLEIELVKIELCRRDVLPNYSGDIVLSRVNIPIGLEVYY